MKQIKFSNSQSTFKKRGKIFKKILPVLIIAAVLIGINLGYSLLSGTTTVFKFIFQETSLKSTDNRVNILLLGNAGGIHDGAYLTDTIMVGSYNLKEDKAYLFSLPRDLWFDKTKSKVNAVYEIGDAKREGLEFSKRIFGEILGIPIHYVVRLDFRGFIKAIDEVGGLEVEVEKSFQDSLYPITGKENDLCGFKEEEREFNEEEAKKLNIERGKRKVLVSPDGKIATDSADPQKGYVFFSCRYELISFKAGTVQMDGEMALRYVRSRMGSNNEGSDFARSKRQQRVIEAFRKKVLSLETLSNPVKMKSLVDIVGESMETDIPIENALDVYKLTKDVKSNQSFVIGAVGKNSLLINPPLQDYGGAWVLAPRGGNFNEIQQFVAKVLKGEVTEYEATASAWISNP